MHYWSKVPYLKHKVVSQHVISKFGKEILFDLASFGYGDKALESYNKTSEIVLFKDKCKKLVENFELDVYIYKIDYVITKNNIYHAESKEGSIYDMDSDMLKFLISFNHKAVKISENPNIGINYEEIKNIIKRNQNKNNSIFPYENELFVSNTKNLGKKASLCYEITCMSEELNKIKTVLQKIKKTHRSSQSYRKLCGFNLINQILSEEPRKKVSSYINYLEDIVVYFNKIKN